MADLKKLSAEKRINTGKGFNRRLRLEGTVPCVFYTGTGDNMTIQADAKSIDKMYKEVGRTTVFNLELTDGGKATVHPVLFWDLMRDPCRSTITHVDFYGVDLDKPVKVTVPLVFKGVARGTKVGGTFESYREKVVLSAKPLDMPSSITLDITDLDLNHTIYVADIKLPDGVTAVYETNFAIVAVLMETEEDTEEKK